MGTLEVLSSTSVNSNGKSPILTPQNNHNGWVNPEDLPPIPQCIAQQDQSIWLSTMTKCTSKRCTSHFGLICTHHQWLTELSCLSLGFSPDVIKAYLPHCSRSVLAKAQLSLWIRNVTGRTWLVHVGDANGLQNLSPASLAEGYAVVDVIYKAPPCLTNSNSASSMEAFQHVVASCSFTSTAQHTGNAARPWEYSQPLQSMIALDSETVGYDLTRHSIRYGDYFDKQCFCGAFTIDVKKEPCSGTGTIDLTKERLWMNATCGPTSLPHNWTEGLKTTEFAYIPIQDWHWPRCAPDMPEQVTGLTGQCATDACELDSSGYCRVIRAVDRACFCRDISYDSCGGSCHLFETRIDYIQWLHDLCGNVRDWHGLPDNWRRLAATTTLDMIPWQWSLEPSNDSSLAPIGSVEATKICAKTEWKLGSLAMVNIATLLSAFLGRRTGLHRIARGFLWHPEPEYWFCTGILIAALQLLANWLNAVLVQNTLGYEDVPVIQLMLLWCTMPRLTWLATLLLCEQPSKAMNFSPAASSMFAEAILQLSSLYYMMMTVNYGREHNFYLEDMERLERAPPAKSMYAGAFLWHIAAILAFVSLMALFNQYWTLLEDKRAHQWADKSKSLEEALRSEGGYYTAYGTLPIEGQNNRLPQKAFVRLYTVSIIGMLFLWIAQWLFWSGFIGLSLEEYVFTHILGSN
ncbi:uncharacterized protein A1O5_05161 [Cladophialophora psammophila CBS 110553]|uniref:Uncharacterized protein n=1 Tax=Cladophialophora psammophila CBS 110553 TaxID=1182543 RepID=W9XLZ7_9EURO|nr:uncharacterized protein A1O5_05161 [Cladophialophora psammophila CBS 110553]EXJ71354.1 hypothetical protein A1O5_05161 [Cladophialophora psammophila CBS 110553]